ncbi:hypothetical protein WICPIJ_005057 [Wickerhamomyces pijperi]|uniref:Uncharacterized protein n=1 Tax=Wickerhamomyces pijperi TaxID=599730 RepID=A0A9P8Q6H0_WICPI|nr:hypothetical protein WICPIJ_005057 [Wickerhamomyces pijperi]
MVHFDTHKTPSLKPLDTALNVVAGADVDDPDQLRVVSDQLAYTFGEVLVSGTRLRLERFSSTAAAAAV